MLGSLGPAGDRPQGKGQEVPSQWEKGVEVIALGRWQEGTVGPGVWEPSSGARSPRQASPLTRGGLGLGLGEGPKLWLCEEVLAL